MVSAEVTTVRVVAEDTFGGGFGVKAFKHGNQRHCRAKRRLLIRPLTMSVCQSTAFCICDQKVP